MGVSDERARWALEYARLGHDPFPHGAHGDCRLTAATTTASSSTRTAHF